MSTYTQIIYQIVIGTRLRSHIMIQPGRDLLFKFITGLLKNKNCHLYAIGGVEDHFHILTHIHPTIALSNLVKDIKLASTDFIKSNQMFPHFSGWMEGYGAFTYSIREKEKLIEYVLNQEAHHQKKSYEKEYREILKSHDIAIDERYFL